MRQCPVEQCTQQGKPKLTLFSNRVGLLKKLQSEFRRMGYLS